MLTPTLGGRGDGDALGTGVPSGGGDNGDNDWNRGAIKCLDIFMEGMVDC